MTNNMKNAIILHGMPPKDEYYSSEYPSASNSHWLPWLQKELLRHDIHAVTPEVPFCFAPDYSLWVKEFERFPISEDTILIGHSCGAGFFVRYLSEHPEIRVGKMILVAPWINPSEEVATGFFSFVMDANLAVRTRQFIIFESDNDSEEIKKSINKITAVIQGIEIQTFHNYGHFTFGDMNTHEFPELLEVTLS